MGAQPVVFQRSHDKPLNSPPAPARLSALGRHSPLSTAITHPPDQPTGTDPRPTGVTGNTLILGCPCLYCLRGFRSIRPQILSPEVMPFKGGRSVGESLRQIHRRMPDKELTPQIEQESVEAVQAYRAERRG
jgi:hypothetical protein